MLAYSIAKVNINRIQFYLMETDKPNAVFQKILVAGSKKIQSNYKEISVISKTIGAKIIDANWILLNGGASKKLFRGLPLAQ